MIKLLYRLFRTRFNQLAFHSQSKPSGFDKLEQAFIDSNGVKYYRFLNEFDIPILRIGKLHRIWLEHNLRMSEEDLQTFLNGMTEALDNCINDSQKGKIKNLAFIGHLVEEMKKRKELIIEPDLLMEMAALLYIRQDENFAVVDDGLQMVKVEQFKKDTSGGEGVGLYDFFYTAGLTAYVPYLEQLKDDLDRLAAEMRVKTMAQMEQVTSFLGESLQGKEKESMKAI